MLWRRKSETVSAERHTGEGCGGEQTTGTTLMLPGFTWLQTSWLSPCLISYAAGAKGTLDSKSPPSEIQPVAGAQKYFCFAIGGCSRWISIQGQQRGEDVGLQAHGDLNKRKFTIFPSPMHHFLSATLLLFALFFLNSTLNIPSP